MKAKSKAGYTPLLFAVLNNHIEAAKTLLEHGANIEDQAPDGTTALNMAAVNAYYDLGSVLLDLGANPNAADPRGSTLFTVVWLRKPGTSWEAAALASDPKPYRDPTGNVTALQFAKKLLDKGANPNVRITWKEMPMTKGLGTTRNPPNINLGRHHLSFVGATPYYCAARNGDVAFMKLLVENGADPKINTEVGVTPLMAAAGLDYYEGESPGPLTGVPEAERLEALKLALKARLATLTRRPSGRLSDGRRRGIHAAHLSEEYGRPAQPGRRRSALGRHDRSARRGAFQPAIAGPVPGGPGRADRHQESPGLDATDDDQGHLHGELQERVSRRGADSEEGDGPAGSGRPKQVKSYGQLTNRQITCTAGHVVTVMFVLLLLLGRLARSLKYTACDLPFCSIPYRSTSQLS